MKAKKGISLIVLVITIIVIIILAGAVILSLSNNNPIDSANKATFVSSRTDANSEALLAYSKLYVDNNGVDVDAADVTTAISSTLTKLTTKYGGTWSVNAQMQVIVTYATTGDVPTYIKAADYTGANPSIDWITVTTP